MKKLYFCILLLIVSSPSLANTEAPNTSGMLENFCQDAQNKQQLKSSMAAGICLGVISAVVNTSNSYQSFMKSHYNFSPTLCVPDGWTTGQGVKVFLKWAKEHPERLHEPDTVGVFASHLEAFPCEKQQ